MINKLPTEKERNACLSAIYSAHDESQSFFKWAWDQTERGLMGWTDDQYIAGCLCLMAGFK